MKTKLIKDDKEKPRYKTQKQYEAKFKENYATMLLNMSTSIIRKIAKT